MKKASMVLLIFLAWGNNLSAQNTYTTNGGEFIFSFSDVEHLNHNVPTKMRFTMFLHLGRQRHFDFNDLIGVYTGLGLRNIGLTMDRHDYVEKRRTFSLGIPAAVKIGSFSDHIYFYGGGEYELFFHYKQKRRYSNSRSREREWFSKRTDRFVPSVFCGVQFPRGINLKVKYYPQDFLNRDYIGYDFGQPVNYADYGRSQIFYVALTLNFRGRELRNIYNPDRSGGQIAGYY